MEIDKLLNYAIAEHIPDFIIDEIWEQKNFLPPEKIAEMMTWCKSQFYDWYDSLI